MPSTNSLIDDLKQRGIRVTPQRAIILDAIRDLSGHFTADAVFSQVQQVNDYISLATIYRTLDLMKEMGLIIEADMGASTTHYARRDHGTHHHAVCRLCNKSIEFSHHLLEPAVQNLQREHGFIADADHIVIFGWCRQCLAQR